MKVLEEKEGVSEEEGEVRGGRGKRGRGKRRER